MTGRRGDPEPDLTRVGGRILSVILRYPAVLLITFASLLPGVHFTPKFNYSLCGYYSFLLQSSVGDKR